MADELIDYVIHLIDAKKGDVGRLNYILSALQDGKTLYNSDKKYLDSLITTYLGSSRKKTGDQRSVEELKTELARVKERLEKFEKRGYRKPVGRKVGFFFGWHAVITALASKSIIDIKDLNPYLLPIYQLDRVIPAEYLNYVYQLNLSIPKIVVLAWGAMLLAWIILGFVYLVKFIRSRYNPEKH